MHEKKRFERERAACRRPRATAPSLLKIAAGGAVGLGIGKFLGDATGDDAAGNAFGFLGAVLGMMAAT